MRLVQTGKNDIGDVEKETIIHTNVDVDDLTVLKRINGHSHDSDVEAEVAVTKIKIRSQQTLESTSIVLNECTTGLSQAANVSDLIFLCQLC